MNKVLSTISIIPFLAFTLASCGQDQEQELTVEDRWYTQSQVDLGREIFQQHCASCHGEKAQGTGDWQTPLPDGSYPPPPLNGTAHAWHHPLSILESLIKDGGVPLGGKMPGFKDELSDEETLAAIAYFQSFWNDKIYDKWSRMNN